ncbi:MAG: TIGR04551 family protein [Deltaproteobacteria bacterium]|nr:TIGR04551 family protein [Deltaproteobacteria bacterium]MBK8714612.1 TIGR04551 family protein [Deltaproteobacteria bacterium]
MTRKPNRRRCTLGISVAACALALILGPGIAAAQPGLGGPGGGLGGGGGPGALGPGGGGPGQRKEKKEGPGEAAPKDKEALRPIEPVPAQPQRFRRIQLFDVAGYMRVRADYFHRPYLGLAEFGEDPQRPSKFFHPPAESQEVADDGSTSPNQASCFNRLTAGGVSDLRASTRCRRRAGFSSANMRLRLEPTLHITDTVQVHTQIDVLDNVVLGSTPDSYGFDDPFAPIDLYTRTQVPPSAGVNSFQDSIVAKRAWGHIRFGWGLDLRFGRMPWHWGMGMVANHGNGYLRNDQSDIIRQIDQDYGDSVDSLRAAFDFGKDRRRSHTVALSWDFASSGATTAQLLGPKWASGGTVGQEFSAERFDNVNQWSASLERRDDPDMLKRKISLGTPVVNYGVIGWLRRQDLAREIGTPGLGDGLGTNGAYYDDTAFPNDLEPGGATLGNGDLDQVGRTGWTNYASTLVHRRALLFTPDLWLRVNWRTLRVELEASGTIGKFYMRDLATAPESADDFRTLARNDLRKQFVATFGYALEFKYGFFRDRFHIGFDHGFATGDRSPSIDYNPQNPLLLGNNGTVGNFRFNPAYNIDLLLFREVLGTVSNAAYFKPWAAFYFFNHFSARVDAEYAMAMRRQATLGNRFSYGVEVDAAIRYHDAREPIFVQFQYGVLFPLGAFNRIGPSGAEDARAMQTLQAQVGIKF